MFVSSILKYIYNFSMLLFQIIENNCSLTINYQSLLMNFVSTMTSEQGVAVCQ